MNLNYRGLGVHLSLPRQDLRLVGLTERTFGVTFISNCVGLVLNLGWINIGFRFWPPNSAPHNFMKISKEEQEKWAEQYVEKRMAKWNPQVE